MRLRLKAKIIFLQIRKLCGKRIQRLRKGVEGMLVILVWAFFRGLGVHGGLEPRWRIPIFIIQYAAMNHHTTKRRQKTQRAQYDSLGNDRRRRARSNEYAHDKHSQGNKYCQNGEQYDLQWMGRRGRQGSFKRRRRRQGFRQRKRKGRLNQRTLVEPPLPLSLPESLPPSSSLEASLPPSSTHPLQIILLTVLAVFIALTVFIMSVLIASGTPPSVVAQAVVLSALCFMSPFGCMMIHSSVLDDENRNAPARLQTSMQAESSEKSPDQYYEHALNAFTQALDTLAAQLSDLKKYDLGLQSQAQQTASSSTAACEATLNAA